MSSVLVRSLLRRITGPAANGAPPPLAYRVIRNLIQGEARPHAELHRIANIRISRVPLDEEWVKAEKIASHNLDEYSRAVDGLHKINNRAGLGIIIFGSALLIAAVHHEGRRRGK